MARVFWQRCPPGGDPTRKSGEGDRAEGWGRGTAGRHADGTSMPLTTRKEEGARASAIPATPTPKTLILLKLAITVSPTSGTATAGTIASPR